MGRGGKRGTGLGRLGPAGTIAVTLVILVAGALLARLLMDGSDEGSDSEPAADVEVPTVTTAQVPTATTAKAPKPSKASKALKAAKADAAKANADAAASEAESKLTKPTCPPTATPAQCRELRRALAKSRRGSKVVPEGQVCPPSASKSECEQIKKAIAKSQAESRPLKEGECLTPSGYVPCEQAIRQIEEATGQPYPSG